MAFHFYEGEPPTSDARRIEVPAGIAHKKELLDFLAKAFPLPAYFGHNWDALEECLLDSDWLTDLEVVLIHDDVPLATRPADQKTYLHILANVAKASPRLRVSFPAASRATIERWFAADSKS